jgi:hypothetical protein
MTSVIDYMGVICMGKVSRRIRILSGIAAGTTVFGFGLFYNSLTYLLYFVYSQYHEIHGIIFRMSLGLLLFAVGIAMIVIVGIEELKEKIDKLEAKLSQQTAQEK